MPFPKRSLSCLIPPSPASASSSSPRAWPGRTAASCWPTRGRRSSRSSRRKRATLRATWAHFRTTSLTARRAASISTSTLTRRACRWTSATASGRTILKRLLAKADVLIESFPPGHLAGLGLGYDDLKEELPDLIYCSITPFGQTGPYRDYQANSIALMALCGLMYVTGDPDREPLATGGYPADYFAALNAWVAVLAALAFREREGGGQHIDVSMLESLGCADEYNTGMYSFMGAIRRRYYSRHLFSYPMDIYACRDGQIVVVPGTQGFPTSMALLVEQPELETHMLFTNFWMRAIQWREFDALIQPWLDAHDAEDILTLAQELRMPFGPVLGPKTLLANAHLAERGFFQEIEHPEAREAHPLRPALPDERDAPRDGPRPNPGPAQRGGAERGHGLRAART